MNRRYFLLLLGAFALISASAQGQYEELLTFRNQFPPWEIEELHLYSFAHQPAKFPPTSTYPFSGTELDSMSVQLLKGTLPDLDTTRIYARYFAVGRIFFTDRQEGLLIREWKDGGGEHHIHLVFLDHEERKLHHGTNLTYAYGYEGGFGGKETWLRDFNQDGIPDALIRNWSHYTYPDGESHHNDSLKFGILDEGGWNWVVVRDSALYRKLKNEFAYFQPSGFTYPTAQVVKTYLEEEGEVEFPGYRERWMMIWEVGKDLGLATEWKARMAAEIGYDGAYELSAAKLSVLKKGDTFFVGHSWMTTENAAKIGLVNMPEQFRKNGHVVMEDDWCGDDYHYEKGYRNCGE